jgi:hypothetical protein
VSLLSRALFRATGMFLICALLAPTIAMASPKPLTPQVVRARLLKRGVGCWAGVELQNGTEFGGRIVSIDDQSFSMQLHNDPEVTAVFYSDVVDLHLGISRGGFWALTAAGIGGAIVFALVAHHEFENFKNNEPKLPTQPTSPVFP